MKLYLKDYMYYNIRYSSEAPLKKKCIKMNIKPIAKDPAKISIVAIVIIFLALIRCICEPFRLEYYSATTLTFVEIKPFLIGSLVNALSLLVMTILFFFGKYKIIIAICILTIVVLLIIKGVYLTP